MNLADVTASLRAANAFRPWATPEGVSPQREFVLAAGDHRTRVFQAGNRCGKTYCGAWDVAAAMLGCHPTFRFKPPLDVWGSALDREFGIGQIMWPALRQFLPPEQIQTVAWHRREPENPMTVVLRNGSQIDFKTADGGRAKYQGKRLHLAWVDEEHPGDIMEEIRARLLDLGGYLNVTCTPVMRATWLQDLVQRAGSKVVRASMLDAARAGVINRDAVEAYAASLPERQRRVRVYGDYVALEGAVWPEFSREKHVASVRDGFVWLQGRQVCEWPARRDKQRPRYASVDFGIGHPMAVLRAVRLPDVGRTVIERCWHGPGTRFSRWAELLQPELGGGQLAAPMFADRDADGRLEFEAKGIPTWPAYKDVIPGLEFVERRLQPLSDGLPGIVLVEDPGLLHPKLGRCDAKQLGWEMEHYHYPEGKDGKPLKADHPVKKDDDAADALRYLETGVHLALMGRQQEGVTQSEQIRPAW